MQKFPQFDGSIKAMILDKLASILSFQGIRDKDLRIRQHHMRLRAVRIKNIRARESVYLGMTPTSEEQYYTGSSSPKTSDSDFNGQP